MKILKGEFKEKPLELWASDKPCRMGCGIAFMINKGEAAVYVHQFHQYHGTGTIVATTGDKSLAMGMHNHEHVACLVLYDFTVVTCTVQYGVSTF